MFHKLLDVFLTAIIFILGIVLFFVILNYALSNITYNMITPSPYPFNQISQVELFERDYKISILNEKLPYQNSIGFKEAGSDSWVSNTTYFGTSNMVSVEKDMIQVSAISLQKYVHSGGNVQPIPPNSMNTGFNPYGNPEKLPNNFLKAFNWYLIEGDSLTSGYMLALYKPPIYPYTIQIDNNHLAILETMGLISPSTVITVNGKVSNASTAMFLGSMQFKFAPLPYVGYHSTGDVYSPSLVFMGSEYFDNKFMMIKEVSMVRNEIGSVDSDYPMYLYYDSKDKKWKPMVFGSTDKDVVKIISPVQASFYSVQMIYKPITVQNIIGEHSSYNFVNIYKTKIVDSYYVVGNPVMTVDENGNLVPYPNNTLYRIVSFSLPTGVKPNLKYQVPITKVLNDLNSTKEFIDRLNSINAH